MDHSATAHTYGHRTRLDNISVLAAVMEVGSEEAWNEAVDLCRDRFHPSLLSELDYRARHATPEQGRELLGHISVTLSVLTAGENLRLRAEDGAITPQAVDGAAEAYVRAMSEGKGSSMALHIRTARDVLGASFGTLPGNGRRIDRLRADLRASVEACGDGELLGSIVSEFLWNLHLLLMDGPYTRLPLMGLAFAPDGKWGGLPMSILPSGRFASFEGLARYVTMLRGFAVGLAEGEVAHGAAAVEDLADVLEAVDLARMPADSKERWPVGAGPCVNCAMHFSSRSPLALDQYSPSISEGNGTLYFRDSLNRAQCVFCGTSARLDTPGLLYWQDRGAVYYRVPRPSHMGREEAEEFYREAVSGLREEYRSQLSAQEAEKFDAAIEIVTHGWGEWIRTVHMGDVIWEDHVLNLVETGPESGIVVDVTKNFMQEVTGREYLEWRGGGPGQGERPQGEDDPYAPDAPDVPPRMPGSPGTPGRGAASRISRLFRRGRSG
ncbi:hypothetical protein [Streptomyces sp. NPDC050504]|uniref:hypothetical protein n=1 Tax=Streptomyces sp. NPDC050504 TaxID=3365618 RepID=UPI00379C278E